MYFLFGFAIPMWRVIVASYPVRGGVKYFMPEHRFFGVAVAKRCKTHPLAEDVSEHVVKHCENK